MNTDLTRQYSLPTPVSNTTSSILEQYKTDNNNNSTTGTLNIPDLQELLNLKAELETLLPLSENRVRDLKTDLINLDKNVKIRDNGETSASGKNVNAIMKIKQESDISHDLHSSSSIPKNEQYRQAALETIRRRRRREETESSDEVSTRRSESPHQMVKLRKLDNVPSLPITNIPSKQQKSTTNNNTTKKKSNNARAQHPLSESSGKQHSKKNNQQQKEELDFIRVKAKDQVPIATFWTALEPYLRNLAEEDRTFLLEKSDNAKYFLIPPLGQYYMDAWAEEDQAIGFESHGRSNSSSSYKSTSHKSKYNDAATNDEDSHGSGSLTERLLSSLVAEELIDPTEMSVKEEENEEEEEEESIEGKTVLELSSDPTDEIVDFEERLRRELRYAGLFGDGDIDWNAKEDDEICAELRSLEREFKDQLEINENRKKKLLQVVDSQLQFEQYRQVLDTLDSQVEQGYIKRFRPQKSKKRKSNGPKSTLSENAVFAMDKRKTWIQALGSIFRDKNLIMPKSSIYNEEPTS